MKIKTEIPKRFDTVIEDLKTSGVVVYRGEMQRQEEFFELVVSAGLLERGSATHTGLHTLSTNHEDGITGSFPYHFTMMACCRVSGLILFCFFAPKPNAKLVIHSLFRKVIYQNW